MRRVHGVVVGMLAVSAWIGLAAPATADTPPPNDASPLNDATTLQVPGTLVGWPLTRGAAVYNPVVHHGHGRIYPTPAGNGYVFAWTNLSTGASGTITDASPDGHGVVTGPGQVVVTATAYPPYLVDVFGTPSVGTFYVTP